MNRGLAFALQQHAGTSKRVVMVVTDPGELISREFSCRVFWFCNGVFVLSGQSSISLYNHQLFRFFNQFLLQGINQGTFIYRGTRHFYLSRVANKRLISFSNST